MPLVRNVEIFVMPGMIYRDRKRKREGEGPGGGRAGGGTDQSQWQSRIFKAMRGGEGRKEGKEEMSGREREREKRRK